MFPLRDLNPTRTVPVITLVLIAVNLAVFLLWQPHGDPAGEAAFAYQRAAIPCEVSQFRPLSVPEIESGICGIDTGGTLFPGKSVWGAVVTSMFLHGSLWHVAGNMWFLWLFGNNVEESFGAIRYAVFYLLAGLAASFAFVALRPEETTPIIGASGAVAGVLGAYLALFPGRTVISLVGFWLLPVPAFIFLGLWFVGQFMVEVPGVAWEAHAAGFAAGFVATLMARRAGLLARHARR